MQTPNTSADSNFYSIPVIVILVFEMTHGLSITQNKINVRALCSFRHLNYSQKFSAKRM